MELSHGNFFTPPTSNVPQWPLQSPAAGCRCSVESRRRRNAVEAAERHKTAMLLVAVLVNLCGVELAEAMGADACIAQVVTDQLQLLLDGSGGDGEDQLLG